MFRVKATTVTVAPAGMALATSKAKKALLTEPVPVFPANRCCPEPLLAMFADVSYRVLSLLGLRSTELLPSPVSGSCVAGTSVGRGATVLVGSGVEVA